LRNRTYDREDPTHGVAISQLLNFKPTKNEPVSQPMAKKGRSVEMIKGMDRTEVEL
jgi:hypothetical protein